MPDEKLRIVRLDWIETPTVSPANEATVNACLKVLQTELGNQQRAKYLLLLSEDISQKEFDDYQVNEFQPMYDKLIEGFIATKLEIDKNYHNVTLAKNMVDE